MRHLHLTAIIVIISLLSTGCAAVNVTGKRFGSLPEDVRHFIQPSQVTLYPTLQTAWQALETGYRYQTDDWYITDRYGQAISGGEDTWLMPSEVQVLIDAGGLHGLDCEDGAIWLTSALRKQGYDAWLCVGTVSLDSGTWGHAWCMVLSNGTWTLYETTVGETAVGMPGEYHLSWRTDGQSTWVNILSPGTWMRQVPIPPDKLAELREALQ
jgi:hypothetical protein